MTEIYVGSGEGERVIKAKLIGEWIHLCRCMPPTDAVAPVTMAEFDTPWDCMWFEILSVSDKCKYFCPEHVGKFVVLPPTAIGSRAWCFPVGTNEMVVRESYFLDPNGPPLAVFEATEEHKAVAKAGHPDYPEADKDHRFGD